MDIRGQLRKKEDKIRAYYSKVLNSATDSKIIAKYAQKSYKIHRSRKAAAKSVEPIVPDEQIELSGKKMELQPGKRTIKKPVRLEDPQKRKDQIILND